VEHSANSSSIRQREIELKPGGLDTSVKADNVIEYIHRLADFRLNRQMDRAAAAFLRGFFELIKPRWVRMFNEAELQMLISGSEEGIDVDDLMQHISYAGMDGQGLRKPRAAPGAISVACCAMRTGAIALWRLTSMP
jgi:hypothetical protein